MRILGIDPGLVNIGYAVWDDNDGWTIGEIHPQGEDDFEKMAAGGDAIANLLETYRPHAVGVEKVFTKAGWRANLLPAAGAFIALYEAARFRGSVLSGSVLSGCALFEIPPTEAWAAFTGTGRRNRHKARVLKVAQGLVGEQVGQHEADAMAVASAVKRRLETNADV